MSIQPINSVNTSQKQQSFKGIWARVGQHHINPKQYCAGAFYKFVDGKSLSTVTDPRNGRQLVDFGIVNMTAKEGKEAYAFLFEKIQNTSGYKAAIKLRDFIQTKMTKDGKHNAIFIEKEDVADITAKKEQINFSFVNRCITDYEKQNNLIKQHNSIQPEKPEKIKTGAELLKDLTENGIA